MRIRQGQRELAHWYGDKLARLYPQATCELNHADAFQLLVATILSAQCTDVRVNMVTPSLFARWPNASAMARANLSELEQAIHSTGFYRNKAKAILQTSRLIVETFGGQVPSTMQELLTLPGVARKTANVVLGNAFGQSQGVVVDTHVQRLAQRLGLTRHHAPAKVESALMELFPADQWTVLSHRLIWHGRRVCMARNPACDRCGLAERCLRQIARK